MEPGSWCGGLATTTRHGETAPVKSELRQPATVPSVQPHHGGLNSCERIWGRNETGKDWRERNETVPVYRWFVRKGDPRIDSQLNRTEETSARFPEVRSILRQLSTKGPCSFVYQQKIKQHHVLQTNCARPVGLPRPGSDLQLSAQGPLQGHRLQASTREDACLDRYLEKGERKCCETCLPAAKAGGKDSEAATAAGAI